jgi:hypothetical protein
MELSCLRCSGVSIGVEKRDVSGAIVKWAFSSDTIGGAVRPGLLNRDQWGVDVSVSGRVASEVLVRRAVATLSMSLPRFCCAHHPTRRPRRPTKGGGARQEPIRADRKRADLDPNRRRKLSRTPAHSSRAYQMRRVGHTVRKPIDGTLGKLRMIFANLL